MYPVCRQAIATRIADEVVRNTVGIAEFDQKRLVTEPVDCTATTKNLGRESVLGRIDDALPHESNDGQREHDRGEVDTLKKPRPANVLVQNVGEQHAEQCWKDKEENQQYRVVDQGLIEVLVEDIEDLVVVLYPDPFNVAEADALPVREGEARSRGWSESRPARRGAMVGIPAIASTTQRSRPSN